MTDEEMIQELAKKYESLIEKRDNDDYILNLKNWYKLVYLLEYFNKMTEELGGRLEPVQLIPKEQHGFVEVVFDVFDVYGDSLKAFLDALQLVDVFSIEALTTGQIRLGMNVNGVYEKQK